jgi:hypothetical protein
VPPPVPPVRILSASKVPYPGVTWYDMASGGTSARARVAACVDRAADVDAVVLSGSVSLAHRYDQLFAARAISRRYPDKPVVLADCTWEAGSRAVDRLLRTPRPVAVDRPGVHLRRISRAAIGRLRAANLHCCVLSSDEQRMFPGSWGFDPTHVHFTPYWASNADVLTATTPAPRSRPLVFAGGDSLRDYRPLLEAAPSIDADVVVATRLPLPGTLPANVTAGPVPQARFLELAAAADVAVVPLVADARRSGGQKTYLGAMALGQVVVVPAAPGVTDYVEPGVTGLVPPADDPAALADAVNGALHDADLRSRIGAAARAAVRERFSKERYAERLYGLAGSLVRRG